MAEVIAFIMANGPALFSAFLLLLAATVALCSALAAFFLVIPGEQPEKFFKGAAEVLQKIADFLTPFSRK